MSWASVGFRVAATPWGGPRFTSSVVDAAWTSEPEVPLTVSDSAYGTALVVVFIVRVDVPEPVIVGGLNPPTVTPAGKFPSVNALSVTVPVKPARAVIVTLNVADWPGWINRDCGSTAISKFAVAGRTLILRVGGLGSVLLFPSTSVRDAMYSPTAEYVTAGGCCSVELAGVPPGNTQLYLVATLLVSNVTD